MIRNETIEVSSSMFAMAQLYTVFMLSASLFLGSVSSQELYNVNHLLDESLKDLSKNLKDTEDVTVSYDSLTVGQYTMTGARLADLSTLKRIGDSWMWNDQQTVIVNGTLSLGSMFLLGEVISGPMRMSNPLITVVHNNIKFQVNIALETKYACKVTYNFAWTKIGGVTLYSDDKAYNNVIINDWVEKNLPSVNRLLVPAIVRKLEKHMNMCQTKYLSAIEMTKYNNDFDEIEQVDVFYQTYSQKERNPRL